MSSNEEIINYIMSTPENANPNVLRGMLGNSSSSNDLTFAQLTIINNSSKVPLEFTCSYAEDYDDISILFNQLFVEDGTFTKKMVLYKGNAYILAPSYNDIYLSLTGNIEKLYPDDDFSYGYILKGDATITIENTESNMT